VLPGSHEAGDPVAVAGVPHASKMLLQSASCLIRCLCLLASLLLQPPF
jgi:hypothetical protein